MVEALAAAKADVNVADTLTAVGALAVLIFFWRDWGRGTRGAVLLEESQQIAIHACEWEKVWKQCFPIYSSTFMQSLALISFPI